MTVRRLGTNKRGEKVRIMDSWIYGSVALVMEGMEACEEQRSIGVFPIERLALVLNAIWF